MEPEVLVGVLAVFVSGGALGVGATLLCQWTHKKLSWKPYHARPLEGSDLALLRGEVADLSRTVLDLNDRLEFQEQLLAGGSPRQVTGSARPLPEPDSTSDLPPETEPTPT